MAISPVGPYPNVRPYGAYPSAPAAPQAPAQPVTAPYSGGSSPSYGYAPSSSTFSIGRLASWAAGGLAAFKYVLPMIGRGLPGLVQIGVVGAGAWAGNKVYNAVTGSGVTGSGGEIGRYAAWAGGAYGAFRLGSAMMQSGRPTGLFLGAMLAGGALAGNWIYNKLTGR